MHADDSAGERAGRLRQPASSHRRRRRARKSTTVEIDAPTGSTAAMRDERVYFGTEGGTFYAIDVPRAGRQETGRRCGHIVTRSETNRSARPRP